MFTTRDYDASKEEQVRVEPLFSRSASVFRDFDADFAQSELRNQFREDEKQIDFSQILTPQEYKTEWTEIRNMITKHLLRSVRYIFKWMAAQSGSYPAIAVDYLRELIEDKLPPSSRIVIGSSSNLLGKNPDQFALKEVASLCEFYEFLLRACKEIYHKTSICATVRESFIRFVLNDILLLNVQVVDEIEGVRLTQIYVPEVCAILADNLPTLQQIYDRAQLSRFSNLKFQFKKMGAQNWMQDFARLFAYSKQVKSAEHNLTLEFAEFLEFLARTSLNAEFQTSLQSHLGQDTQYNRG